MKTLGQLKRIFALAKERGLDDETVKDMVEGITEGRSRSRADLYFAEANALIVRLGGSPFGPRPAGSAVSRRTDQYRRQKAGIKQIVTQSHLEEMQRRADLRRMSAADLEALCRRTLKRQLSEGWQPRTTKECNAIIEALKAMEARDRRKAPVLKIGSPDRGGRAA